MAMRELAAIGAVGGPEGAIVGGVIGLGIDIFNFFSGAATKAKQTNLENQQLEASTTLQLTEAKSKAKATQDFLSKMPTAGDALTSSTGDLAFDQSYRSLLADLGNANVLVGATGRVGVGTSGQAIGQAAKQSVTDLVDTSKSQAQQQLDIYNTTVSTLQPVLDKVHDVQKNPDFQTSLGNWWADWGIGGNVWTKGLGK